MRYCWVNQKQTYRHEIGNGFLWSPKQNSDGSKSPFCDSMTEIELGEMAIYFVNPRVICVE